MYGNSSTKAKRREKAIHHPKFLYMKRYRILLSVDWIKGVYYKL